MEKLEFVDRRGTNSAKWDGLEKMFGRTDLHSMWVADMDFKAPLAVRKALSEYAERGAFGYMASPDSFYRAAMDWEMRNHDYRIEREWIRFSPGVVTAFHIAVKIFTEGGDSVMVNTPVYYPFFKAAESNGRKLVKSPLKYSDGKYSIDFEKFSRDIEENNVKLYILCSPHNPVGRVWTAEELRRVLDICREHGVMVVSDEIHHDLIAPGVKFVPALQCGKPGEYDQMVIALTAPSKTFNLAAGQNSLVIIPDEELRSKWDAFAGSISMTSGNPMGYIAGEAAYNEGESWYNQLIHQIYEVNFPLLNNILEQELPGVTVTDLQGTYLSWIDRSKVMDPSEVEKAVLEKGKLAVDFGHWFRGESFSGFVRMNLAAPEEYVEKGARALVSAVK